MKFDYYENLVSIIILTLCILFVVFIINIYYLKQYFLNNFEKYRVIQDIPKVLDSDEEIE